MTGFDAPRPEASSSDETYPFDGSSRPSPSIASALTSSGDIDHGRFPPGTILGGRYCIVGRLGRGGMKEVFRADDLKLHSDCCHQHKCRRR